MIEIVSFFAVCNFLALLTPSAGTPAQHAQCDYSSHVLGTHSLLTTCLSRTRSMRVKTVSQLDPKLDRLLRAVLSGFHG